MSDPAPEHTVDKRACNQADAHAGSNGVVSQYETPLLRYVGQFLGQGMAHEAEDVVQETFLRYYKEVSRDEAAVRNAASWLFRVAHNLTMDALRRQARQSKREARLGAAPPAQPDALENLAHRESCDEVLAELRQLPEAQRQVLLLRVVQGMKLREIGEVTGLTPGNAGYRIGEGLRELARRLKARGVI